MLKQFGAIFFILTGFLIESHGSRVSRSLPGVIGCSVRIERTIFKERESQILSYEVIQAHTSKTISEVLRKDGYALIRPVNEIRRWSVTQSVPSTQSEQELVSTLTRELTFSALVNGTSESLLLRIYRGEERAPLAKASTYSRWSKETNFNVKLESTSGQLDQTDQKMIFTKYVSELICLAQ